jgi:predicted NUDIX family NTP pyrophosphohydrolase
MPKHSAGIVLYRKAADGYEVLLVHPGGPFWAKKDLGSWSIPKGEFDPGENSFAAAKREFQEEIGAPPPGGDYYELGNFAQPGQTVGPPRFTLPSGKTVHAFALESDFNLENFHGNMFELEWPPKSGRKQEFPEVDRAAWVSLATAREKVVKGQVPIIESLAAKLGEDLGAAPEEPQTKLF